MTTYSDVTPAALAIATRYARGCYQRAILRGVEAISGATLTGRAREYGYWYARSRTNLLARLRASGQLRVAERRGAHGKRVLVLRCAPGARSR